MTQAPSIRTNEDLRRELAKIPRRLRTSLTALSEATVGNYGVLDFINRPHVRTNIKVDTVFAFVSGAGHEFVAKSRPVLGIPPRVLRSEEDLRDLVRDLPMLTGMSLSALNRMAGVSNTLHYWIKGDTSRRATSVYFVIVLKVLDTAGLDLSLRRTATVA